MVSPREVAPLWPPAAALSQGRIFQVPSSRCWWTAKRSMHRHALGEPKMASTSPTVYGPRAVPPATSAMDLAQSWPSVSSPRSLKRLSMDRFMWAFASAFGMRAMSGTSAGRSTVRKAGTPDAGQYPTVGKP